MTIDQVSQLDEEQNRNKSRGLREGVEGLINANRHWGPSKLRTSKAKQIERRMVGLASKVPTDELGPLGTSLGELRKEFELIDENAPPPPTPPDDLI